MTDREAAEGFGFKVTRPYLDARSAVYEALQAAHAFDPTMANWQKIEAAGAVVLALWPLGVADAREADE